MRTRHAFRALLVVVAFAMPVAADAPISGVDKQYDDFATSDRSIRDRFTHLVWDRPTSPYPLPKTFAAARAGCPGTMRLPSLKELLTLVDETPHYEYEVNMNVAKMIDANAFGKTPAKPFWTSSLKDASTAWTVDFGTGETKQGDITGSDTRYVRCVEYVP